MSFSDERLDFKDDRPQPQFHRQSEGRVNRIKKRKLRGFEPSYLFIDELIEDGTFAKLPPMRMETVTFR